MSTQTSKEPVAAPDAAAQPQNPVPDAFVPAATGRRRTLALLVVLLGLLVDLLDITVVNVALPRIQEGIGIDAAAIQWVIAGYTLSFALMLITSARLGDLFGRKRIFVIGMAGFTIASMACGFSQTPGQLVAARIVQGAFGALMVPQVLSTIQVMYAPHERGRAFAILSGVFGIGTVGGPLLGAVLTEADFAGLSWRSIFLVNVPVGILAIITALIVVPESKPANAKRLDVPGVIILTAALFLLVYPLVQGRELGWPWWTFVSMAASLLVLALFVVHQRGRKDSPLVPMTLFRFRSFDGGLLVSIFFMGGVMPFFLLNTLYLQVGQGFPILKAGLTGIMWGIAVPLFGAVSSRVIHPKLGRAGLQLGLLLMMAGMFILMWTISTVDTVTPWHMAPGLFIGGMGMGMSFPPIVSFTLHDVPVNDAGPASGVYNTVQQVGAVLGIAAGGVLFFSILGTQAAGAVDKVIPGLRSDLAATALPAQEIDRTVSRFRTCFIDRMGSADPYRDVPSCRTTETAGQPTEAAQKTATIVAGHTAQAIKLDYQRSMVLALWYMVIMFGLGIGATMLLPKK
ncbi:MFS transporter [Catelliglobosispora koreensis]|uniref:MFS transporter n=1 Tax=Catelliglobosispora koreensis TaxID=129052 RepID=UPI00036B61D6|nr:MFS transporter [Catelliglobosispora koreensis]